MEGSSSSSFNPPSTKLKVSGLWSGVIEVDLGEWTVPMLRAELAKSSQCPPENLKVICAGKILKDESTDKNLRDIGLKANSRILISKVDVDQAKAINDELDAQNRLSRIKAAVDAMAKRHTDNSFPVDDFNIELENQSGQKMKVGSETDQRALVMGLMLHAKGRHLIKKGQYKDALDILGIGEEAFSVCDRKVIEMVDNASLLQIDTVWCYFMQRDISCLAMAGIRLKEARKGLEHCYGANMERARVLQGGFCPEIATYTRLELLEGVVAYHTGLLEESCKALTSAQAKYQQLQVSDESLSTLLNIGFTTKQSRRALRMCGQDVQRAVEFAIEERERIAKKEEEDRQHYREIREQKSYGRTAMGKVVDMTKLTELASIGYERPLAAEALRRNENDFEKALDELTDPDSNSALQGSLVSRQRKRRKSLQEEDIAEMMSMGFERGKAEAALLRSGTKEEAIDFLLREIQNVGAGSSAASEGHAEIGSAAFEEERNPENATDTVDDMQDVAENHNEHDSAALEIRDEEMEKDIVNNLTGDPLADYDIEVEEEGKAIVEYLSLLVSAQK